MNKKLEYLNKVAKPKKVNLGAINVLQDALDGMQWDERLNSVEEKYEDFRSHANEILTNGTEIHAIQDSISDIYNTLKDLGLDETQEFIDLQNEANRIKEQVQELSQDLFNGKYAIQ